MHAYASCRGDLFNRMPKVYKSVGGIRCMSGIDTIEKALTRLGVTESTLSDEEKRSLDEQGFVIFPNLISPSWLTQLQDKFEELIEIEGENAGKEVDTQERGARRLSDLVNKGEVFDGAYTNPKVLAAVYHILRRDFKFSSLNGRDAIKGQGQQPLHEDWNDYKQDGTYRKANDPYYVANSLWMLDDFTFDNGATRVVPGTHKWKAPQFYLEDRLAAHPDEIKVLGKAGTVVVFNSHLWHGGTTNVSGAKRRTLHAYYVVREFEQQLDQRKYITRSTYDRISPAAKYILDVEGAY